MGEDNPDLASIIHAIAEAQRDFTLRFTRAAGWIGCEPALPGHEASQVNQHITDAVEAALHGDWQTATLEAARARKHLRLGSFDSIAIQVTFILEFVERAINVYRDQSEQILLAVERELARQKAILVETSLPPTQQRKTLEETETDINEIRSKSLVLLNSNTALSQQASALMDLMGPENVIKMLEEARSLWGYPRRPSDT
jgi:hypothetical protein